MLNEFFSLGLSRKELQELYRATLVRFLMETSLRQEQGLEAAPYPPLLEKMEHILRITSEEAHELFHRVEEELWEFSWCHYTNEWAWYRARLDVLKELGSRIEKTNIKTIEQLVERRYEEYFEKYVHEIDMKEVETNRTRISKSKTPKKQ